MTSRQAECLAFVRDFIAQHGYSPSYREIADGLGLSSTSRVAHILASLRHQGHVTWKPYQARSVELRRESRLADAAKTLLHAYEQARLEPSHWQGLKQELEAL